jgi:hypothetical protein
MVMEKPITVGKLKHLPYPRMLIQAFQALFDDSDVITFWPLELGTGLTAVFHIVKVPDLILHRYEFVKSEFIFMEPYTDLYLRDFMEFLVSIEERLEGDDLLDKISWLDNRTTETKEFEALRHFYWYKHGYAAYPFTEESSDND